MKSQPFRGLAIRLALAVTGLALAAAPAAAQNPEIMEAAGLHMKTKLGDGPRIAANHIRAGRGPAIAADRIAFARALGATAQDVVIRCADPSNCQLPNRATLVSVGKPRVQGDSASVVVHWLFHVGDKRIASRAETLELVRGPTGRWTVVGVSEVEIS